MPFQKKNTDFPGLYIINPTVFGDHRGFFMELYHQRSYEELGLKELHFVQDNLSRSSKGTIRGLHFQEPPYEQGKLITSLEGKVLDIAVDLRRSSPTFGKCFSIILDASNPCFVYLPPGIAHGFQVLSDTCLFFYKCTSYYHKEAERGIAWDDPALNIPWEPMEEKIISDKDLQNPLFEFYDSPFM